MAALDTLLFTNIWKLKNDEIKIDSNGPYINNFNVTSGNKIRNPFAITAPKPNIAVFSMLQNMRRHNTKFKRLVSDSIVETGVIFGQKITAGMSKHCMAQLHNVTRYSGPTNAVVFN